MNSQNVLLINYNRPEKTIKTLKPLMECDSLFLFCDGGNTQKQKEIITILEEAKKNREEKGLKTYTRYEKENLGTAKGPTTAINWFFENVEQGHIIEDDILIHPKLLEVQEELLKKYKDSDVLWIGGGHSLPNSKYAFIKTKTTKLLAWSSWRKKIEFINKIDSTPTPWRKVKTSLLKGLPLKTKIYLAKEFTKLEKNPSWSWYYLFLQKQLFTQMKGITPTAYLHTNLGTDGSGHNYNLLFGEKERFDEEEIINWTKKIETGNTVGEDKTAERKMEWQRHGKLHQLLGRQLIKIAPKKIKKLIINES